MKKLYATTLGILVLATLLVSCRKEVVQSETIKEYTVDTTIVSGSTFKLDLASVFSPGKKATIIDQANYFQISTIDMPENATIPVYTYSTSLPAGSTDNVTLAISDLDDGTRTVSKDSTIIYVNFTIR